MYKKVGILFVILMLFLSPISGAATNWDSFQGNIEHTAYRVDNSDFVTNLWTYDIQSSIHSSPALYKDTAYFTSAEGRLVAVDIETGEEKWDFDLESKNTSSPVVHKNKLYVGTEDGLKAVNINNHELSWEYETNDAVCSTPIVDDDTVYFGCDNGHIYGVDKADGSKVLNKKLGGELKSSPIIKGDNIYIGSSDDKLYSVSTDGDINWKYTTGDDIVSSPSFSKKSVLVGSNDGSLYSIYKNGSLNWKVDLNNKVLSSPTVDKNDNSVYIGSDEGNMTCLDVRDGTIKWSFSTGSPVQSSSALKEKLLAFGSNNGNLYVLNKYTGQVEFSYNPGTVLFNSQITSSPVIYGDTLLFGDDSGHVYSLNIDKYEVPASIYLYYSIIMLIIAVIACAIVIKFVKGRK